MADTTFVLDGNTNTTHNDINHTNLTGLNPNEHTNNDDFTSLMPTIFFTILAVFIAIKIRSALLSKDKYYILRGSFDTNEQYINAVNKVYKNDNQVGKEYFLYKGKELNLAHQEIETILTKYFVYYRNLETDLQFKFYDRLIRFMYSKRFLIYSDEPFKEMPVLISAAAVQISFGLNNFELPHYQNIQVKKREYFAENSFRILAGNVQENSITLAWNQLLKGYDNYEDGSNVGLHEMAHALYYQEMIVANKKNEFAQHFNQLMNDGESVLQQKQCPHNLYSNYAFTNLQEFWAVSVELFFERANHLNKAYPNIYNHLQDLLKQNPLVPSNPV
jgi:hypothetical protein